MTDEESAVLSWLHPHAPRAPDVSRLHAGRLLGVIARHRLGFWLHSRFRFDAPNESDFDVGLAAQAVNHWAQGILDARVRREVLAAMVAAGIACVPLKGAVLGPLVYGHVAARPAHDLDVLVPSRSMPLAESVLHRLGYRQADRAAWKNEVGHDRPFWRGADLAVDLHRGLSQPRRYGVPEEQWLAETVPWTWEGIALRRLSDEAQFLHLVIHAAHHKFLIPWLHWLDMRLCLERGLDLPRVLRLAQTWRASIALKVAAENLAILFDDENLLTRTGRLNALQRVALADLTLPNAAITDSRGVWMDHWHAFWMIESWRDRFALGRLYAFHKFMQGFAKVSPGVN